MSEANHASGELKGVLISLFQQLGLFAQASKVQKDHSIALNSPVELANILRKQGIGFTAHRLTGEILSHIVYPAISVSSRGEAQLIRRQEQQFEKLTPNLEQVGGRAGNPLAVKS